MSDPIFLDQADIAARLEADAFFADVPVLIQRKGVTESDIEVALSTLNEKSGSMGALAVVLMPALDPESPEAPGPRYRIVATVQVIEQPLFNLGDSGTGKSAEQISERVRQLLHHCNFGRGSVWTFAGMDPVDQGDGKIAYGVRMSRLAGDSADPRQPTPTLSAAGSTITVSADPLASVYYTTDGSYPHAGNTEATLYAASVTLTEPGTFRAVAYRPGYLPSNVACAEVASVAPPPPPPPSPITPPQIVSIEPDTNHPNTTGLDTLLLSAVVAGSPEPTLWWGEYVDGYEDPQPLDVAYITLDGATAQIDLVAWRAAGRPIRSILLRASNEYGTADTLSWEIGVLGS